MDHICVGVPDQECFGLLGQNGAGKTTTFKMLTGDVMVTGGNAYLKGYDVRNDIKKVRRGEGLVTMDLIDIFEEYYDLKQDLYSQIHMFIWKIQ